MPNIKYKNLEPGLLLINGITNRNLFEFYIQPQDDIHNNTIPTCFHVTYGNFNFPEFIPKFTYYLCNIYSNWQGNISISNVMKAAKKLSKMAIKYANLKFN